MNIETLSAQQLRRAADIQDKIESLTGELNRLLGGSAPAKAAKNGARKMSAAGRARIVAAQKARWAKVKGKTSAKSTARKPKRVLSAAARAKIAAAQKARWAKAKETGKKSE